MLRASLLLGCLLAVPLAGITQAQDSTVARPPAVQHELVTEYVTNPVEYRALVKQALEAHLGALGLIVTRRAPDSDHAPFHADALVKLTAIHAALFPPGSATPQTRESIWSDPERFESASNATAQIAEQLRDAVERENIHQVMSGLVALGESCASCHAHFRVAGDR